MFKFHNYEPLLHSYPDENRWFSSPSGDDGGAPPAGSLVYLGYFQCDGYERAQYCLEKEEESL